MNVSPCLRTINIGVGRTCATQSGITPLLIFESPVGKLGPSAAHICKFITLNMCTGLSDSWHI